MKRIFGAEILTMALVAFLAGCGGGTSDPVIVINPKISAGTINPVTQNLAITVTDSPPAGVTILSFAVTITGAVLQPGNVSLVAKPVRVELKSSEAEPALLGVLGIPEGSYDSLTVTLATPKLTFLNNSGAAIGSCANGAICETSPALSTSSVTLTGAAFPINVTWDYLTEVILDFDLNNAVSGSFSVGPAVSIESRQYKRISPPKPFRNLFGQVSSINRNFLQGPTFFPESPLTVTLGTNWTSVKLDIADWTVYQGFGSTSIGSCNDVDTVTESCFVVGQMWEADVLLQPDGSLWGSRVRLAPEQELSVLVVASNGPDQFDAVVLQEKPDVSGVELGNRIQVHLAPGAAFGLGGDYLPTSGFLFTSDADLLPGQVVDIRLAPVQSGTPPMVDVNRVLLRIGSLTATVKSKVDAFNFTVGNLPRILTSAQVGVSTSSQTVFENAVNVDTLQVGDTVSLAGFLFKTPGDPVFVARKVRKR